ncbi:MAG: molybdopterin molybdotransferase MoeA [Gemmatimonadetes bacterium]|nr:molybdopterin molybdotransferase MoeA [Gemmatimonadota bacterium]
MLRTGFQMLTREAEALRLLLGGMSPVTAVEDMDLEDADGRVLAAPAIAPRDVPHYDRCAMDGYAVHAADTAGASPAGPVPLYADRVAGNGRAVPVHTGSALPSGADAVLPVEDVEGEGPTIGALRRLRPGEHVGRRGEDIRQGDVAAPAGHVLRPADLGLLRALGIERLRVTRAPRVRILTTGEELVAAGCDPAPGQMVDSNGILLAAAARRWGGIAGIRALHVDRLDAVCAALRDEADAGDLVVTSGGTSVGVRDQVVEALREVGAVTFHGVAIQPARPVAAGRVGSTPVLCLPGFPAATFIASFVFLRPALARLGGAPPPRDCVARGRLSRKLVSTLGLRTYVRVRFEEGRVEPIRTSGAGILSSVVRAHGFVVIPEDSEGLSEGSEVDVVLFD